MSHVDDFKVWKKANWRTAGRVATLAATLNTTSAVPAPRKSHGDDISAKLAASRKKLEEKKKAPVKDRLAERAERRKTVAAESTGVTELMSSGAKITWDEEGDEQETKKSSRASKRMSSADNGRKSIAKRASARISARLSQR